MRAAPITTLHLLGLIDQVVVCHNIYLKVCLAEGVTDDVLKERLIELNKELGYVLYHSFTDSVSLFDLNPTTFPLRVDHSFFVVDSPPFAVSNSDVIAFFGSKGTTNVKVAWGTGLRGTCLVVSCDVPVWCSPPSLLALQILSFFYHTLPQRSPSLLHS